MRRDALGDADHGADAGVDRLVDRVGGEAGRDEDHRRVRAGLPDRLGHGVEDRDTLDVLAALAGGDAGDELRAVGAVAQTVEASPRCRSGPGRRASCPCRRRSPLRLPPLEQRSSVERQPSPSMRLGEQLPDAVGAASLAAGARSQASSGGASRPPATASTARPAASTNERHSGSGVVADVQRVAQLLGLLDRVAHVERVSTSSTRPCDARHLADRARESSKWCAAIRKTTRSKDAVANGRCSAGQITSGPIPGAGSAVTTSSPPHAAAGRRARRRSRRRAPSCLSGPVDDQVEIRALALLGRVAVGLGALRPHVRRGLTHGKLHRAPGSIEHRRLDVEVRRRGLREDPPALLCVRAVEAHHDRLLDRHLRAPAGSRARPRRRA